GRGPGRAGRSSRRWQGREDAAQCSTRLSLLVVHAAGSDPLSFFTSPPAPVSTLGRPQRNPSRSRPDVQPGPRQSLGVGPVTQSLGDGLGRLLDQAGQLLQTPRGQPKDGHRHADRGADPPGQVEDRSGSAADTGLVLLPVVRDARLPDLLQLFLQLEEVGDGVGCKALQGTLLHQAAAFGRGKEGREGCAHARTVSRRPAPDPGVEPDRLGALDLAHVDHLTLVEDAEVDGLTGLLREPLQMGPGNPGNLQGLQHHRGQLQGADAEPEEPRGLLPLQEPLVHQGLRNPEDGALRNLRRLRKLVEGHAARPGVPHGPEDPCGTLDRLDAGDADGTCGSLVSTPGHRSSPPSRRETAFHSALTIAFGSGLTIPPRIGNIRRICRRRARREWRNGPARMRHGPFWLSAFRNAMPNERGGVESRFNLWSLNRDWNFLKEPGWAMLATDDQTTRAAIVTFGEAMLRYSVEPGERLSQADVLRIHPGGAELNVGVGLANLGEPVRYVTALPDSPLGQRMWRFIAEQGVEVVGDLAAPGRMGIYYLEPGV